MLEDQQSSQLQQASSITPQVMHTKTMQKQSLPHLRAVLAGGAYGTHVTKRKRWGGGKATTAANDDYGPAQALANVLQQWQPNTIANAQTNKRFKKSQSNQSNLREQLLSVLTTNAQSSSDQEVVSKISHILQPYLGKNAGYDDSNDHEHHYDDTGQQSYYAHSNSSKQHHVNHNPQAGKQKTRWNKSDQFQKKHNASSPAIKGLIASEWTQVPKILESQELMRKIRAGESDDTTNIAPVNSIAEAKQLVSSWKAFGSQGGYTLLLTGPAKSMPGATPARIRVLRNNAIFKVEEVALFALGDANQAIWIKPTITVQPQTLPKIDRVTVRIAAPEEFRQHFIDGKDKPRLIVAEVAQWSPDVKASALIGGNWAENTHNKKQLLTGFLNLPTSMAKLLVAKSGTRGISPTSRIKFRQEEQSHGLLASQVKQQMLTSTDVSKSQKSVKKVCITGKAAPFTHWDSPKLPKKLLKRNPNNTLPVACRAHGTWKKSNSFSKASAGQKWQISTKLNTSLNGD